MRLHADAGQILRFFSNEDPSELPARRRLAWRVGDSLRDIIDRLVDTRAPESELEALAADLDAVARRLESFEHGRRYDSYGEASTVGGPPGGHVDYSPLLGRANPLAPPMHFSVEDDTVVATVTFGHAYEGPPGHVHGGMVAAAFDEIMGATQAMSGQPGMTGTLSTVYRAPTPLHQQLRLEATLDDVEGRKIHVSARLFCGETLCAESTGVFISVDFGKLAAMQVERDA